MIYTHSLDYAITSEHTEIPAQTGRLETRVPGGASSIPREQHTRLLWQPTSHHIYSGPEGHTDTNNKAGNRIYQGMSHIYVRYISTYNHLYENLTACMPYDIVKELCGPYMVQHSTISNASGLSYHTLKHKLQNTYRIFDFYTRIPQIPAIYTHDFQKSYQFADLRCR